MNIAFIVGEFPSLSETFILEQICNLLKQGYKVKIYASKPNISGKIHKKFYDYHLSNICEYRDVPHKKIHRLLTGVKILASSIWKSPRLLNTINIFRYKKKVLNLEILFISKSIIDSKFDPDIIICHFGNIGNIGAVLKDCNIITGKLVTFFHGKDMSTYINRQGKHVYDLLFKKGDIFLPISKFWRKRLIELGCDKTKIHVFHMGVNTEKYVPCKQSQHDSAIILTVARLVEKKGLRFGIDAVKKLVKVVPNVNYFIIGSGELKSELMVLINKNKLSNNVHLLGPRNQDEVYKLMSESDIYLAPSVMATNGDMEGIPVSIMEAMSLEKPIVSTLHSGIPELVQDGLSGFLVKERDSNALFGKLLYLIKSPELQMSMGKEGRKIIKKDFNEKLLNDKLICIFREIMK